MVKAAWQSWYYEGRVCAERVGEDTAASRKSNQSRAREKNSSGVCATEYSQKKREPIPIIFNRGNLIQAIGHRDTEVLKY